MPEQKQDRRLAKTDRAIRNALLDLLAETPLSKISVSELARKADIDRKTFYLHYATVEDAFQAIADGIIADSVARIEDRMHHSGDVSFLGAFEAYFSSIGEIFLDERFITMRKANSVPLEITFRYYGDSLRRLMMQSELFLSFPESARQYLVSFLLYLTVGTYNTWLDSGMKESLEELTTLASGLAAQGLGSVAGAR